jgi:dihydrofolate synthase/folylpolyglutamate synthase
MTYPDALSYLGQTRRFGMKLGLDSMRELARALDNPQDKLRFIHIAGTNGKGSTAAFCESCLRTAGFRVGLYTSPHLVSVRERIQIDRVPISEAEFAQGMTLVRETLEGREDHDTTFFELMTALALWYFAREKVDWVVWETGLGGRLDATNIVTPEVCIITNIGLDHQQYLGDTLAEIAREKAGIIKPGVPVVSAVESGEALEILESRTKEVGTTMMLVPRDMKVEVFGMRGAQQLVRIDGIEHALRLIGPHQATNAACAIAAMNQLHYRNEAVITHGLESASWPGRFEILSENPLIVLDGAHNPAGMKMLVETWRAFLASRLGWAADKIDASTHLVFAAVADKDISEMAQLLRPLAREVLLVRLANERSADPAQLAPSFAGLPCTCYDSVSDVWPKLVSRPESIFLITGSLFLVGEMLARRQPNTEEYRLNERLEKVTAIR